MRSVIYDTEHDARDDTYINDPMSEGHFLLHILAIKPNNPHAVAPISPPNVCSASKRPTANSATLAIFNQLAK